MSPSFRPNPIAFERSVSQLCLRIETVSGRAGFPGADCGDLDGMLAAMPPLVRDRVKLMLQGTAIQTEYDDPEMALASRYVLRLAQTIWEANPHPLTHGRAQARSLSRSG